MQRRLLIPSLIIVLAVAGAWTWNLVRSVMDGPAPSPAAVYGGPFTLVDHNGKTVTDGDFRGRYLLVFFGYTYCPDVCPTALQTMAEAMDLLGAEAARVQPLFISVDPERDTPEVLKWYVGNFHPRLIGLSGTPDQVAAAAKGYRARYVKVREDGADADDYYVNHTAAIYLMGPDGAFITRFGHGTAPEALAAKIRDSL